MRWFRWTSCIALVLILGASCSSAKKATQQSIAKFPALPDSLSLCDAVSRLSIFLMNAIENEADSSGLGHFNQLLDSCVRQIISSSGPNSPQAALADSIISLVYKHWAVQFSPSDTIATTLLPHLVYRNRSGACVGTGMLILMLADRLHCPIFGVLLPGHFFCRFEDGTTRFNIEPNRGGMNHPDEYYRERYGLLDQPWYSMRDLSSSEAFGVLCYNIGNICLRHDKIREAESCYREAIRRLSDFPEAQGNLALVLAQRGSLDSAELLFVKLSNAYPRLPHLSANYGSVLMAERNYRLAANIFRNGLTDSPQDERLLSGLSEAYRGLGQSDSAAFFRSAAAAACQPTRTDGK